METTTAHEALKRLKDGNERFRTGRAEAPGRVGFDGQALMAGQRPFAAVLGCSDSRVPTEIVFDTGLGDLFVIRIAGNVATPSTIASVEFALANLGTKLVVVMAHQNCGAVTAAVEGADAGKHLNRLVGFIEPALAPGESIDTVARRNAQLSAQRLIDESPIVRGAVESQGARIVTAFFHFSDGRVDFDDDLPTETP